MQKLIIFLFFLLATSFIFYAYAETIQNNQSYRITIRLSSANTLVLQPKGRATITKKDMTSYGIRKALEDGDITILSPETLKTNPKSLMIKKEIFNSSSSYTKKF